MDSSKQQGAPKGNRVEKTGLLVLGLLCLLQLGVALYLNDGAFCFTLDDPYIHLALAENLWESGHYGVNLAEPSAPSSSVIWPFLIAPLSHWPWAILLLNVGFSVATVLVMARVLKLWAIPFSEAGKRDVQCWLMVGLLLATNQVGLAFLGMEHSLQLWCASLLALGLLRGVQQGALPGWIWPVFILAPLVRYEMLALDAAVLAYAWTQKQERLRSLGSLVVTGTLLGAFSGWLRSMGLAAMPSSIKAKVAADPGAGWLQAAGAQLLRTLTYPQGIMMLLGVGVLLWGGARSFRFARDGGSGPGALTAQQSLGLAIVVACVSHFCVGKYGWFYRYEVYVWGFYLLLGGFLVTKWVPRRAIAWLNRSSPRRVGITAFLALAASSFLYVWALVIGPLGSNNIYEQQYQMHRLLREYYPYPVAVNDLGWVAYKNPNYVLDLWGLGSEQARQARFEPGRSSAWMDSLARENQVRLVMVYDEWFDELPPTWSKIGTLSLGKARMTPAHAKVAFYLIDKKEAPVFCQAAQSWVKGLPRGVVFHSRCR